MPITTINAPQVQTIAVQQQGCTMKICLVLFILITSGCTRHIDTAQTDMRRDAERYAIAACLAQQNHPYLSEQGQDWAGAIVQRAQLDFDVLKKLSTAVRQEPAKGNMAVGHRDSEPVGKGDFAMPVLYCAEIIDTPLIRAAIERAIAVP